MSLQWSWQAPLDLPVAAVTPLVANLTDDNGDGSIDLCDTPDVVVIAGKTFHEPGRVFILDGASGVQEREFATEVTSTTTPVIGDLDDDGVPEIITALPTRELIAFEPDGSVRWISPRATFVPYASALVVTDLWGDGRHEILAGATVLDADGGILWSHPERETWGMIPVAADLDGDGVQEVVLGATAYHADGTLFYENAELAAITSVYGSNFAHVADLGDGHPSIVLVSSAGIAILDASGTLVRTLVADPSKSLAGGPIAIADLGSGHNHELIVSSTDRVGADSRLRAFSKAGEISWDVPAHDGSCCAGAVAFDLDGDGRDEIIYNDQLHLIVLDANGTVLATADRVSQTMTETPVVADVDNDGAAEIVVVSSAPDPAISTMNVPTVQVFRDTADDWAPTRRLWNQNAYIPTAVREDATVPLHAPLAEVVRANTSSPACGTITR
ncbi:MAG: repeat-HVR protein [Myxococcales bacterium]|nr:repeat-HVR protein [Myxococcales bacterium]